MKKQVHVFYKGRVQGVGFRFTAVEIARSLGVVGWVKNCSGGHVELVAQADEETLQVFLQKISLYFGGQIVETSLEWLPVSERFSEFGVEF